MTAYRELLPVALEATRLASELMRSHAPGELTFKGDRDMASEVDYLIEREVADFLKQRTPSVGFLGEEDGTNSGDRDLFWAFDPIDGTVNFIHGIPICGISLGLIHVGRPRLGVINLPFLNREYTAVEGQGAYSAGQRIFVSKASDIHQAIIGVGDYAVGRDAVDKNRLRFAVTQHLAEKVQRIRMNGSAAVDLSWLAEGKLDASVTLANHPWDIAAGVIIAREAGAQVMDLDGSDHSITSQATVVATPGIATQLLALLQEAKESVAAAT